MTRSKWLLGCLLAVNGVLGGTLVTRCLHTPTAQAQIGRPRGGRYLAGAGYNGQGGIVYVMNLRKGLLSGLVTQQGATVPVALVPRNIFTDIKIYMRQHGGGGGRSGRGGGGRLR